MTNNSEKGFAIPLVIAIVALILVIGGVSYFATRQKPPAKEDVTAKSESEKDVIKEDDVMMEKKDDEVLQGETMMKYSGETLAGNQAPLLDFNNADYAAALKTDRLVVLYFYANWCPICKAEFPKMQEVFDELATDKVIGFRVNYNDNETDDTEKSLARQFGVAYQHTKVFLKKEQRILKSPEGWGKDRYVSEIRKALGQ